DHWVRRTEDYLARVEEMRNEAPTEDQKKKFAAELNQFLADYQVWWKNGTHNYPSGGHKLWAALYDGRFEALPLSPGAEDDGPRELADLPLVEAWLTRIRDAGIETRNSPLLGNSRPTSE